MQRYFLKEGDVQQGPFTLEELATKGLKPETMVCAEGTDQWISAGQAGDLKSLFSPVTSGPVMDTTAATPVAETRPAAAPAPVKTMTSSGKKSTAWVSYVVALLVLGGVGYYIYQDMEKNKDIPDKTAAVSTEINTTATTDTTTHTAPVTTDNGNQMNPPAGDTTTNNPTTTTTVPPTTSPTTDPTTTVTTVTNTTDPAAKKKAEDEKKKMMAADAKKKADEAKKKQAALDAKKKEDEAKRLLAQQMQMRNNWPSYISLGSINYEEHDGIKPFTIPVYNTTGYGLEKVTLRVDYIKKEGKGVGSETLVLSNVPGKGSATVQAAGNKKAKKANVYITGVNSRGLHFCFPVNNGNSADPYFCN